MKNPFLGRTSSGSPPGPSPPPSGSPASGSPPAPLTSDTSPAPHTPDAPPTSSIPGVSPVPSDPGVWHTVRWHPSARLSSLATAALAGLIAAVITGHAAVILLAAPALGALALMPRRRPPSELIVHVTQSGSRCFEGEDVTIAITVRVPVGPPLDLITLTLDAAPQVTPAGSAAARTFPSAGSASATWVLRPARWGRYSPATIAVSCRTGQSGWAATLPVPLDPIEVFPRPARMRPRLVPAELLRRIGEHTGRATGSGVEFAGIRPYVPGDQLRDVNRPVSIRRGQLHVNQRAASRAADLVIMIDAFTAQGPVADATLDLAVHGAAALATSYLRVSDRAGLVILGGMLRWLGPASGDRQFYRIAERMLEARYDSFVAPDVGRIPRTALPPGTLVVVFSPLLDPRAFTAITDLRQRGYPLILIDTLRHEPPVDLKSPADPQPLDTLQPSNPRVVSRAGLARRPMESRASARSAVALRLWRLDRAATHAALRDLGVPVLRWDTGTELDSVLAPLRQPPPAQHRASTILSAPSAPAVRP
jgi:uncharacterized protein (DUF58 family)